jgi:diguanylate cyclase (GGDEF)-like protein
MRILIIEDDAAIADAIVAALTRAGHAVDRLSGGRQADAALQAHPYDLIVLDLGLPEMDGVELLKRLRARADAVPVLVATAREALDERVRALDLGADDYLVKPAEPNELLARVRSGLRLRRALLELAAKNELLERLALTDPLTALPNRRAYEESLTSEIARATRHCKPLALLYLDIDRFKEVNDLHGHAIGDEALLGFADLLRRHARRGDLAARIGGEEFAVLLPHTGRTQAALVAERIRRALEAAPVGRTRTVSITTSVGVATFSGTSAEDAPEFTRAADEALYRAKSEGRNRVALAPE